MQLAAACASGMAAAAQAATEPVRVPFSPISAATEAPEKPKPLPLPEAQKVGYALVGLGRLTMNQLLPAFGRARLSRPVALVSGDRAKAQKVAAQHDIPERSIYDYASFDRIADNPDVQVVYIVLPNAMHAEFTVRAARAGKHVLCEKPMAVSVAECRQMIDACSRAREVEDTVHFLLQFPSGFVASCGSSYSTHKSQFLRLSCEKAWAELDPAFAYSGLRLRVGSVADEKNTVIQPEAEAADQFAREMDHMSRCVRDGLVPHTPGEEGLQDHRIMEAIYASARSGRKVTLTPPPGPTRGPEPAEDDA